MAELDMKEFKIQVLLIDPDREYAAMLCDILSKTGVCISQQMDTIPEAQKRIDRGSERVDVCILEVYSDCVNESAIEFVKNNVRRISTIVLTKSESAALGARCHEAGAKKVIDKKNFDKKDFIKKVYKVACLHLINPGYSSEGTDTFNSATGILFEKSPVSVTAWAELTGISDRQLRGLVKKNSKVSARDALKLAARLKT
jgi:CheY-like chemotaxis protein